MEEDSVELTPGEVETLMDALAESELDMAAELHDALSDSSGKSDYRQYRRAVITFYKK